MSPFLSKKSLVPTLETVLVAALLAVAVAFAADEAPAPRGLPSETQGAAAKELKRFGEPRGQDLADVPHVAMFQPAVPAARPGGGAGMPSPNTPQPAPSKELERQLREARDAYESADASRVQYARRIAELTAANAELTRSNVELRIAQDRAAQELERAGTALRQARVREEKYRKKLDELNGALARNMRRFEEGELQRLYAQLQKAEAVREAAVRRGASLERRLGSAESERVRFAEELKALRPALAAREAQLEETAKSRNALAQRADELDKRSASLRRAVEALTRTKESLETGASEARTRRAELHRRLRAAHRARASIAGRLAAAQAAQTRTLADFEKLRGDFTGTAGRLREAESKARGLAERVSASAKEKAYLAEKLQSEERHARDLKAKLEERREAVDRAAAELKASREETFIARHHAQQALARERARFERLGARLEKLSRTHRSVRRKRDAFETERDRAVREREAAGTQAAGFRKDAEDWKTRADTLGRAKAGLERRLLELSDRNARLEREAAGLEETNRRTAAELENYRRALSEFQGRFDEINGVNKTLLETIQKILKDTKERL